MYVPPKKTSNSGYAPVNYIHYLQRFSRRNKLLSLVKCHIDHKKITFIFDIMRTDRFIYMSVISYICEVILHITSALLKELGDFIFRILLGRECHTSLDPYG